MKFSNAISEEIWKDRYQRDNETVDDNIKRVAKFCSNSEEEYKEFYDIMDKGLFFPAGRPMANAYEGSKMGLNNCFVHPNIEDNIVSIFNAVKDGALVQQSGGGIGYDFSLLRPTGSLTSKGAIASGVVSFMNVFNTQTSTIVSKNRRGANMGVLSIRHPDIYSFIESKSKDASSLNYFNISVMVDDEFMKCVENNSEFYLHWPVYDEKYKIIKDSSKWKISKKVKARELWDTIMKNAYDNGEPGVLFYDTMNRDNNTWYTETITTTNPCVSGDTLILTKDGYVRIDEVVGQPTDIWNGFEWSNVTPKITGHNQKMLRVSFSNNRSLKCTLYHKFILNNGERVEAKNLKVGDILHDFILPHKIDKVNVNDETKCHGIYVTCIESLGYLEENVYCFNEPKNHSGLFNGIMTAQCGEYLAGTLYGQELPDNQYGGACNLGSLYLHQFVKDPFTSNSYFDRELLKETIKVAVRLLDNIIDKNNYPLDVFKNYQTNMRTIGLGVTGLGDMLTMLNMRYSDDDSIEFVKDIMDLISYTAYKESMNLAKEKGSFPFFDSNRFTERGYLYKRSMNDKKWKELRNEIKTNGIRNARMIVIAPSGTMSLTFGNNCSQGIEPIFSLEYDRKVKIGGQDDSNLKIVKFSDYAYELCKSSGHTIDENIFVTALNLPVEDHVRMLETISYYCDSSISKTINIPEEYPFEKTKSIYMSCWKHGVKGCTIFRPNSIRQGILIDNSKKQETEKDNEEFNYDKILPVSKELIGKTYGSNVKKKTSCGKLYINLCRDKSGNLVECFVNTGKGGVCTSNINALSRMISLALRSGVKVSEISDQLMGIECKACAASFARGNKLDGISCPDIIGKALNDEYKSEECIVIKPNDNKTVFIEEKNKDEHNNKDDCVCPECGGKMVHNGGCVDCLSCGYSHCG